MLFLIFIHDNVSINSSIQYILYAGDSTTFPSNKSTACLKNSCNKILTVMKFSYETIFPFMNILSKKSTALEFWRKIMNYQIRNLKTVLPMEHILILYHAQAETHRCGICF